MEKHLELALQKRLEQQLICQEERMDALNRLLIWRVVQDGGITEELLAGLSMQRSELEKLLAEYEHVVREYENMHRLQDILQLEDLFALARGRLSQMLAGCEKPSDLRSLLGCLKLLPGSRQLLKGLEQRIEQSGVISQDGDESAMSGEQEALRQDLLQRLNAPGLNRQQRRGLERRLAKLQRKAAAS